jgi:hypothetical protein
MKDLWSELARQARKSQPAEEPMPFGFEAAVMRRLATAERENPIEAWLPMLRPALGLAFATAVLCVILQVRGGQDLPPNLLVETDNLIQLAVSK